MGQEIGFVSQKPPKLTLPVLSVKELGLVYQLSKLAARQNGGGIVATRLITYANVNSASIRLQRSTMAPLSAKSSATLAL